MVQFTLPGTKLQKLHSGARCRVVPQPKPGYGREGWSLNGLRPSDTLSELEIELWSKILILNICGFHTVQQLVPTPLNLLSQRHECWANWKIKCIE